MARMIDKGRVTLNGTVGEYHFACPLDQKLIEAHDGKPQIAIKAVRDWVQTNRYGSPVIIPDGKTIYDRYWRFLLELPELRRGVRLDRDEKLILVDYQMLVIGWIAANDWRP